MTTTMTRSETFEIEHCCACGMAFAMTGDFQRRRANDHELFYCPAGHRQHYTHESDKDKAQRLAGQLDIARTRSNQLATQLDYARRSRKAVSTRLRKVKQRVGHGVCPCCNRSFQSLARHMETQHPGYAATTTVE